MLQRTWCQVEMPIKSFLHQAYNPVLDFDFEFESALIDSNKSEFVVLDTWVYHDAFQEGCDEDETLYEGAKTFNMKILQRYSISELL
jgi:hypothetical protein